MSNNILITCALPYANGPLHIGHFVEQVMGDCFNRYQLLQGRNSHFFCADDSHGTPIMIRAKENNMSPDAWTKKIFDLHIADLKSFGVEYDHYSTTNTETNKEEVYEIFERLKQKGMILEKKIEQLYCDHDQMFLPDRFVKGTCPNCKAEEQYGDQCESCSRTHETTDLLDPKCSICSNTPKPKQTSHLFFDLPKEQDFLEEWVQDKTNKQIVNKLKEWFKEGLKPWCVTRDKPYFGFEVPGHPGKFFYVWMDAPVGYIATSKEWCQKEGKDYRKEFWQNPDAKIFHIIGKDIINFHTLFWPAILKSADYSTPSRVQVHGMLNFNGQKMSKSRGHLIEAKTFADHVDPMYLRFYFASKLNAGIDDLDFSPKDFCTKVNSALIGKITNLASRGAQMLAKHFDSKLSVVDEECQKILLESKKLSQQYAEHCEQFDFAKAIQCVLKVAEMGNAYFDSHQPWKLIKEDPEKTQQILTGILNVFRHCAIYLKPFIPSYTQQVEELFGGDTLTWAMLDTRLENSSIEKYKYLAKRVEEKSIDKMIELSKPKESEEPIKTGKKSSYISIDDFAKVELKVGKVISAEAIPEAKKLLKLVVDLKTEKRTIFSGIKASYSPEELEGKNVVVVTNLKPRKMKFGVSEGMILAAGNGKNISLLFPDQNAQPGDIVS